MDFFSAQESLTAVQWILRAVVGFVFFVLIVKIMGQRTISQVGLLDFVIVLIIGNIIAHPLSDEGLGLKGSMITMGAILVLYLISILLSLRSHTFKKWFTHAPIPLVENGQIHYENLKKARISVDILLSELRKEKAEDIQKVALALWEPVGDISVFLKTEYQPITPSIMGTPVKSFEIPKTIVKEKNIIHKELQQLGKNEEWLLHKLTLAHKNIKINDILLATIDENENVNLFLYPSSSNE